MENLIEQLKTAELKLFKNFIEICNNYNLKYFLLGGSCLGAVRHKGFIPWDDDIDVGMPRSDYNKFLEIAQNELPENIFLQTYETDSEYPMNFAKLRNGNTTFIEKSTSKLKINHGIWIDIFPLDGISDNNLRQSLLLMKYSLYSYGISQVFYFEKKKTHIALKQIVKIIIKKATKIIYSDIKKTVKKREKLMQKYSYDDSKLIANYGGAWGKREIVPKEYFGNGVKGIFEGIEVMLPEDYDKYLTSLYGDYMTPPPPEKRVGHHYYTVLDIEKSYVEYI